MKKTQFFIVVAVFLSVLTSCVAVQPFPNAARAGDTITLAVGSLDGASKDNLTVIYTSDSNPANPTDITQNIRSVFKIYPDPTSPAYIEDAGPSAQGFSSSIAPWSGHGPWQTVVAIDLPPTLPQGDGIITITLGPDVLMPNNSKSVESIDIQFTILDLPAGTAADFEYYTDDLQPSTLGNLARLSQSNQAVVRRTPHTGQYPSSTNTGAVEYTLNIPIVDDTGTDISDIVTDESIRVALDMRPGNMKNQINLIWSRNAAEMKVIIVSHVGKLSPERLRFSIIVLDTQGDGTVYSISPNASITLVKTFDQDGLEISTIPSELVIQGGQIPRTSF